MIKLNLSKLKFSKNISAYTIIEASFVIIIFGILVMGIYQGSNIYRETIISRSQSLTQNSIIGRMSNVILWYETSLDKSLSNNQKKNSQPITQWFDNNSTSVEKHNATASQQIDDTRIDFEANSDLSASGPSYIERGINYLPTLRFKNTATNSQYLIVDPVVKLGSSSLHIFMVMRFKNFTSNTFIFDRVCLKPDGKVTIIEEDAINLCGPIFSANINSQGLINFSISNKSRSLNVTTNNTSKFIQSNKPYIIQFERDFNQMLKFYLNGKLISSATDDINQLDSLPLKIGRHSTLNLVQSEFDLSEIVIIEDKIKIEQKKEIESYLSKKYAITLDRDDL